MGFVASQHAKHHQGGSFIPLSRDRLYVCFCMSIFFLLCLTGIPDSCEEDLSVARALSLRWTTVLKSDQDGTQTLINSDEVSTVDDEHAINNIQKTHDY